ncbi:9799_t:CDS:2, partial [Gigaspora margarita]
MSDAYPDYIEEFSIEIADYNPISPTSHMPLPETIPKYNNGALHLVKVHPERNLHRLYGENNPDISLCVYEWHNQNKCLEFRYITERRSDEYKQVNLLVITGEDRSHYCIIKDLHKLVYNHSKHKGVNNASQLPKVLTMERSIKEFSNYKCMQPNPYHIFWDLECLTKKLTPKENIQLTRTEKIQRHKPCGYCYVVVRIDSSLNYEIISYDLYKGPDALEKFIDAIEKELLEIQTDLFAPAKMIMEPDDYKRYNEATECWICMKLFVDPSPEILQQFEEAKKDHPEKKNIQKEYREALSAFNYKVALEKIPDIQSIAPDAEIGYILEVDLEALVHLHDFFADYLLAPEKQLVPENWLSLYNERLVKDKEIGNGKYVSGKKLVQTLFTKKNYVIHYRALQTYMKFGMKVTRIHGALKFQQAPWMKDYIEENIRKRKIAKANGDEFGVIYYKLKNNAVFGKQIENVRKHMRVELLRTEENKKI